MMIVMFKQNYGVILCCLCSSIIVSIIVQIGFRLVISCIVQVFRWCSVIRVRVNGSSVQNLVSISSRILLCRFGIIYSGLVSVGSRQGISGVSRVRVSVLVFSFSVVIVSGLVWLIMCLLSELNIVISSVEIVLINIFRCMLLGMLLIISVIFGSIVRLNVSLCSWNGCLVIYGLMIEVNIGVSVMQVVVIEVLVSFIVLQNVSQCRVISVLMLVQLVISRGGRVCNLCQIRGSRVSIVVINSMCYYISGSVGRVISLLRMVVMFYSRIQKWICYSVLWVLGVFIGLL